MVSDKVFKVLIPGVVLYFATNFLTRLPMAAPLIRFWARFWVKILDNVVIFLAPYETLGQPHEGRRIGKGGAEHDVGTSPLVHPPKDYAAPSVFLVENMIREGRRQMDVPEGPIPKVCVLDPDGDIVRDLQKRRVATKSKHWPCYHSELWVSTVGNHEVGFVPFIVGSPYAVLVADELFACGCKLVIHITSAGEVLPHPEHSGPSAGSSFFVLVEKALRDEGTSLHWQPASTWSVAPESVLERFPQLVFDGLSKKVCRGASWTTDSPFRETQDAIERAKAQGILCVEMESAALIAFANTRGRPVVSFAQVTNSMAVEEGDFEKGDAGGSTDAIELIRVASDAWFSKER